LTPHHIRFTIGSSTTSVEPAIFFILEGGIAVRFIAVQDEWSWVASARSSIELAFGGILYGNLACRF
jgi:hypothetical protein